MSLFLSTVVTSDSHLNCGKVRTTCTISDWSDKYFFTFKKKKNTGHKMCPIKACSRRKLIFESSWFGNLIKSQSETAEVSRFTIFSQLRIAVEDMPSANSDLLVFNLMTSSPSKPTLVLLQYCSCNCNLIFPTSYLCLYTLIPINEWII